MPDSPRDKNQCTTVKINIKEVKFIIYNERKMMTNVH